MSLRTVVWSLAVCCVCVGATAHAHKPSDAYLTLHVRAGRISGQWDIALRDLDRALSLDADGDGAITWGELSQREVALADYALARLSLHKARAACELEPRPISVVEHSDGPYARLPFTVLCARESLSLDLRYAFLFDLDAQHRAIVRIAENGQDRTLVLRADAPRTTVPLASAHAHEAPAIIAEGVRHILGGLDHVLFLLALLLPVVLRRDVDEQSARAGLKCALRDVFKVVTAFTVAHSLTLGLAALGIATVPASIIEPAIAASVALAALDNLRPMFGNDRWSVAFALGLLHGFGFSSALADIGMSADGLLQTLFAFNLGVELGQLAIVILFVPIAFLLRRAWFYEFAVVRCGSLAIAVLSVAWFVERMGEG
jgi:hypothetical protein